MQLTAQEAKLIERLRRDEQRWPRTRWALLAMAVLILAIECFISSQLLRMTEAAAQPVGGMTKDIPATFQAFSILQASQQATFALALFWPQCVLGFCAAFLIIGLLIRDWRGNVQRMLLLRLLEAQQKLDHAA
jgi:hypothetical protein